MALNIRSVTMITLGFKGLDYQIQRRLTKTSLDCQILNFKQSVVSEMSYNVLG